MARKLGWILTLGIAAALAAAEPLYLPRFQMGGMEFAHIEVARTEAERVRGLMHRTALARDGGMLFAFREPDVLCFWMKNTLVPLDILFLDSRGTIVSIATMTPEAPRGKSESEADYERRLRRTYSRRLAVAALEIRGGLAAELGLRAGYRVPALAQDKIYHFLEGVKSPQK